MEECKKSVVGRPLEDECEGVEEDLEKFRKTFVQAAEKIYSRTSSKITKRAKEAYAGIEKLQKLLKGRIKLGESWREI